MNRGRFSTPFPLPILFKARAGAGLAGVITLPAWEITRGVLEMYDAAAALIAYNPDWSPIPAQPASIATLAWTPPAGFLGYFDFASDVGADNFGSSYDSVDVTASDFPADWNWLGAFSDEEAAVASLPLSDPTYTHADMTDLDTTIGQWAGEYTSQPDDAYDSLYYVVGDGFYEKEIDIDGNAVVTSLDAELALSGTTVVWLGEVSPAGVIAYLVGPTFSDGTHYYYDTELGEVRKLTGVTPGTRTPAEDDVYYDLEDAAFYIYREGAWVSNFDASVAGDATWNFGTGTDNTVGAGVLRLPNSNVIGANHLGSGSPYIVGIAGISKTDANGNAVTGLETLQAGDVVRIYEDASNYYEWTLWSAPEGVDGTTAWTQIGTWNYAGDSYANASGDIQWGSEDPLFTMNNVDNTGTNRLALWRSVSRPYGEVRMIRTDTGAEILPARRLERVDNDGGRVSDATNPFTGLSAGDEVRVEYREPESMYRLYRSNSPGDLNPTLTGSVSSGDTVSLRTPTVLDTDIGYIGDFAADEDLFDYFDDPPFDPNVTYIFLDSANTGDLQRLTALTIVTDGTFYETTNNNFQRTTDAGATWSVIPIMHASLLDTPNAVFLTQQTSQAARTHLDTGTNYNAANTYYFYDGTEIRRVTSFTASIAAGSRFANFMLADGTHAAFAFIDAVINGTVPLNVLALPFVDFSVDINSATRRFRIPVILPAVPLPTPQNLTFDTDAATLTSARISWDAVQYADSYRVAYRIGTGPWQGETTVTTTAHTFTGLQESTTYQFRVIAEAASDMLLDSSAATVSGATLTPFVELPNWDLTRGILQTYDAYAALIAHNADWATIPAVPAQNASIATQAWTVPDGFVGYHADNDAAAAALPPAQGASYTQVDVGNNDFGNPADAYFGERTINFLHDVADDYYYNTTDNEFRKSVSAGGTQGWDAVTPAEALAPANAVWLGERDSAGVLSYFDSNTYDSSNTYYYFDTDLGEVRRIDTYTPAPSAGLTDTAVVTADLVNSAHTYIGEFADDATATATFPTTPGTYTQIDVQDSDFYTAANWIGEEAFDVPAVTNADLTYSLDTGGTRSGPGFYVRVEGSWSLTIAVPSIGFGALPSGSVWLGQLDSAGVISYFTTNTYDTTLNYFYYDTTLNEVRKITSHTAGAVQGQGSVYFNTTDTALKLYHNGAWVADNDFADVVNSTWRYEEDLALAENGEITEYVNRSYSISKTPNTGATDLAAIMNLANGTRFRIAADASNYLENVIDRMRDITATDWTTVGTWELVNYAINQAPGEMVWNGDDFRFEMNAVDSDDVNRLSVYSTGDVGTEIRMTAGTTVATFLTDSWNSGGEWHISPIGLSNPLSSVAIGTSVQIEMREPVSHYLLYGSNFNFSSAGTLNDGDSVSLQTQQSVNFEDLFGATFLSAGSEAAVLMHFASNPYDPNVTYIYYDTTEAELLKITSVTLPTQAGSYFNTTDGTFRKTTNGMAWSTVQITDADLTNDAAAVFVSFSIVATSVQMRQYLDNIATYDPDTTYYFYNSTEIRRVSSFTASVDAVDAVVKLTNYALVSDTVPLAFDIAGLLGGNVPVAVTDLPHVDFTVDVEGTEQRFRIPVTLALLPLDAPTGLTIDSILFDRATLGWSPVPNAESYRVAYRVGSDDWSSETTVTTTAHTFTGLSPNTTYEFRVIAEADGYSDSDAATVTDTTLNDQLTTTWSFTQGDNALLNLSPILGALGPATDLQLAADTPAQFSVEGLGIRERTGGAFVEEELATDDFVISSILQAFGVTQDNLDYVGVTSSPTSEVTETVGKAYYDHFVDLRLFVFIIETSPGDPDTISAYQVQPADALRSYGSGTVVWLGHRSQMEVATYNENTFNANDTYYYFNTSVNAICRIVSYSPATVPNVSQIVATATIAETTVTVTIDLTIMVSTLSAVTNITRRVVFRLVRIAWDGVEGANNYRIQYRRRTQTDPIAWTDWTDIVVAHIGAGVNHIQSFTISTGGHHEFRIWTEAEGFTPAVSETLTFTTIHAFGGSDEALNVIPIGENFILIGNELILMER